MNKPVTLSPLINEILRTRYCVPGSIFLVEDIQAAPFSKSRRWQVIRLLLGDGEMCIQALLTGALHRFVETHEIEVGCCVRVDKFFFKRERLAPDDEQPGEIIYLVVEDVVRVGWNGVYRSMWEEQTKDEVELGHSDQESQDQKTSFRDQVDEDDALSVIEDAVHADEMEVEYPQDKAQVMEQIEPQKSIGKIAKKETKSLVENAFNAFEALTFPSRPFKTTSPLKQATSMSPSRQPTTSSSKQPTATSPLIAQPIALPRDWHNPQTPLKLTTLRSIPYLPYTQNWSCNVLAILISLDAVTPSHLPPYRQRIARIADPSTTKHVHLTVFLDPDEFAPTVGSAVLLVGVKNHRFDGGSLKKYVSDAPLGGRWWFEEPWELGWCDVAGIKTWWADMERYREVE